MKEHAMKQSIGYVSTSLSRVLGISILSACLIYSPLWPLKSANPIIAEPARGNRPSQISPQQLQEHQPRELLIKLRLDSPGSLEQIFQSIGEKYYRLRGASNIVKLKLKDHLDLSATLTTLQQLDNLVEWVEPNYLVNRASNAARPTSPMPNDPRFPDQWALENRGQHRGAWGSDIGVRKGWRITTGSRETVIAVIDTGIDVTHPDLKHNLWTNPVEAKGFSEKDDDGNGYVDDVKGWNFINDTKDVTDNQGHGTMVAGIIAAEGNNAKGVSGVMQKASLMPLKALDESGRGTIAGVVEAIDFAAGHRASIINCSFGTPAYSRALLEAINRASIKGIIVVAAAGNAGKDLTETPYYPAGYQAENL